MTYPEALHYLDSFINYEKQDRYDYKDSFRLDRMKKLVRLLGDPQAGINSIHIAGTKGKGSTCAIVYSILRSAGFRVGLYTSPHLVSFCERIRIDDSLISEDDVGRLLDKVRPAVDGMGSDRPTFFEVYTALACLYFNEQKVDFAVYEVGLGGRLDATNVVEPLVCAITPISYEHMDKLGNTLGEIASEKAGIIKDGSICVIAPQEKESAEAIGRICRERKARAIFVGRDIRFKELAADDRREVFSVSGLSEEYPSLEMGLLGPHQVANAATAIGIVEALGFHNITIRPDAIKKGVALAEWAGRLEIMRRSPLIILDGAQNRSSAKALASAIKRSFKYKELILVLGVSKDKDIKGITGELFPISSRVILTKSKIAERAMEPSRIKELAGPADAIMTSDVSDALKKAVSMAGPDDMVLVTGSLFVVGEARELLISK